MEQNEKSIGIQIVEHSSSAYSPRTYYNASAADLTVAFACDMTTAGERLTKKAAKDKYIGIPISVKSKPSVIAKQILDFGLFESLNIAGNGIYTLVKYRISQEFINQLIFDTISEVNQVRPLKLIVSGGQTGVDIAGAVAAFALQIPAKITFPKGFRQRLEDGVDYFFTQKEILDHIEISAEMLIRK